MSYDVEYVDFDSSSGGDVRKNNHAGTKNYNYTMVVVALTVTTLGCLAMVFVRSYVPWIWTVVLSGVFGGVVVVAAFVGRERVLGKKWILGGMLLAICIRLILMVFPAHELSDDIYRYHWDGKVLVNGINPYMYSPDDPKLAWLRTEKIDRKVNHPYNLTCYPPGAQFAFALGYIISPSGLTGLHSLFLFSEIVAWCLLLVLLRRKGLPEHLVLVAALMPLGFSEGYLPGHVDPLAFSWLCGFLLFLDRKQALGAAVALAVAVQFRPLFLLFAPVAAFQFPWKKSAKAVVLFILVTTAFYLPFLSAGHNLFSSTWLMAKYWRFNASLSFLGDFFLPEETVRIVAAAAMACLTLFSSWWYRHRPMLAMAAALMAFVAFSPTVFAWYISGALILLTLEDEPALLTLVVLLPLSELVMIPFSTRGLWQLPMWARLGQYLPFYAMLLWELFIRRGVFSGTEV